MICGYCKAPFSLVVFLEIHWKQLGCPRERPTWALVVKAKQAGHSGRRILHERWPDLYPSEPMSEETKEKLKEIQETRKREGVRMPRRGVKPSRRR